MTPIHDTALRLAYLEAAVERLKSQQAPPTTLANFIAPRDLRLVKAVAPIGDEEEYPIPGETLEFPFRFIDSDWLLGDDTDIETPTRSLGTEEPVKGYLRDGGYLCEGDVCYAFNQRGLRRDLDADEYGEWWLFGGRQTLEGVTMSNIARGDMGGIKLWKGGPPAETDIVFQARAWIRTMQAVKRAFCWWNGNEWHADGEC